MRFSGVGPWSIGTTASIGAGLFSHYDLETPAGRSGGATATAIHAWPMIGFRVGRRLYFLTEERPSRPFFPRGHHMPLSPLVPTSGALPFDVQQTTLSYDVLGRFVCNTLDEVVAAQAAGGFSFDAVVIGSGMFGGYFAAQLYRLGTTNRRRILVLDAGALFLPTHSQNLPQRTGGQINAPNPRFRDNGTQNIVWGMPWISAQNDPANKGFPGLAYCVGGRSLFWGGWSPRLTAADLAAWPASVQTYLTTAPPNGRPGYEHAELEMGSPSPLQLEVSTTPPTTFATRPCMSP